MIKKFLRKLPVILRRISLRRIATKSSIVLLYIFILVLCLYAPRLYNFWIRPQKFLVVYTTRQTVASELCDEFERQTGIKVKLAYFTTNEEMFAKFKINRGRGYDVVVASDYTVQLLIKEGLLHRFDRSKLTNFSHLDRRLLGRYYDPSNDYSVPISWIPYGIGFDKRVVSLDNTASWEIMYKKGRIENLKDYKISMLNDSREAVFLTAIYLFGTINNLTSEQLEQIKDVLVKQKEMVEAYVEAGAKYFLVSGIVPLCVIPAARMKELDDPENFGFVIPREGSLVDILNVGIPISSKNIDEAHKLIDFLLSAKVGAYNFEKIDCNPANKESYALIDEVYSKSKAFFPDDQVFERLYTINNQISPLLLEKIWFLVKSA